MDPEETDVEQVDTSEEEAADILSTEQINIPDDLSWVNDSDL